MTNNFDKNVKKRYLIQMRQIHPNIESVSNYSGQAKKLLYIVNSQNKIKVVYFLNKPAKTATNIKTVNLNLSLTR